MDVLQRFAVAFQIFFGNAIFHLLADAVSQFACRLVGVSDNQNFR